MKEYNAAADNASKALQECPKPTIAMVRGYCIGGGTAIAVNCDMRIASEDAKFGVPAGKTDDALGQQVFIGPQDRTVMLRSPRLAENAAGTTF